MSTTPATSRLHRVKNAAIRSLPLVIHHLKLIFFSGPRQLLTSRISTKCASIMAAMCAPSLLFCALLIFPAMIFQSPHQNAYFEFAGALESDPTRWAALFLAGLCALMSLALPATMPEPQETSIY